MIKNNDVWTKYAPYNNFYEFISENADRYSILLKCIDFLKLNSAVIPVDGNRHIFIFPPRTKSLRASGGIFPFKGTSPVLFSAHYDRVPGSPGANDNSIAVFHLITAAIKLAIRGTDRWIIVFTDKEEIKSGESLEEQGSYSLAKKLISWGLEKARIFNFDACGIGDTFIFSTTTDSILKDHSNPNVVKIRREIHQLRDHALATANLLRYEKLLLAPTPFSDDVGFLRAGLAAQTITLLPSVEAANYESIIRTQSDFADLIISGRIKEPLEYRRLPETWKNLNNKLDTPTRLTPDYFDLMVKFMVQLASSKS